MDNRPIGVFDSGMGGLTAVRELIHLLPGEDIVYFGDTGRVPYGGRSSDTIIRYAKQDVAFLRTFDLKAILIACGTVSTTALSVLSKENNIPILGVLEPAAVAAVKATKNKKIGIIGTKATIRTNAYATIIESLMPDAQIASIACPLFVPLVENGRVGNDDKVTAIVVEEYLQELKDKGIDTLVLGCTHYPLLTEVISQYMGKEVTLINSGRECSIALKDMLTKNGLLNKKDCNGSQHYFASDSVDDFTNQASIYLGTKITGLVDLVAIGSY